MNLTEAKALTDGAEVFIRATVVGGTHRPTVDSDGFLSVRIPYAGGYIARGYHHSSLDSLAPPKPKPLEVGDITYAGKIVAIAGDEAWINVGTDDEPNCGTFALSDLTRA